MRTIHILGDSIARGYALGAFAEEIPATHPLYDFRSLWSMANGLLASNGAPGCMVYKNLGSPVLDPNAPTAAGTYVQSAFVSPGDVVIFEDAGKHTKDPDAYQEGLEACLDAAERAGVVRAVMTMFDYDAPEDCQYDTHFAGRSINDAIRAAGASRNVPVIDMNAKMDEWRTNAATIDGCEVVSDGIHPNVWGQMRMVGVILHFASFGPWLLSRDWAMTRASENWQALAYGAPNWTQSRAEAYTTRIVTA